MYNLEKIIVVALTKMELNFDELGSRGLHKNHGVTTWNLGTNRLLSFDTTRTIENKISGRGEQRHTKRKSDHI
jgi:hypothetical protein